MVRSIVQIGVVLAVAAVVLLGSLTAFGLIGQSPAPAHAGDDPTYTATIPNDGTPYALGIPGPTVGTLGDLVEEPVGLSIWTYESGGWERITDLNRSVESLDAYVIATAGDVGPDAFAATIQLEPGASAPPRTLEPGWNLVPGTAFTDAEDSFGVTASLLVLDRFAQPPSDDYPLAGAFGQYVVGSDEWGEGPPSVSPFGSYFVYAESATSITPQVSNVTDKADADAQLQLPDPSVTISGSSNTTLESDTEVTD